MKKWYNHRKRMIFAVAIAGVPIGYLGIWLNLSWLMWSGIVLALPLFVVVLPYCVFLLTASFTRPIWYPFYRLSLKRNGIPFREGDVVRVLRGPHKGKVVRIYKVWSERDQVRVDLGEEEEDNVTGVFSFISVRKLKGCNSVMGQH